MKKIFLFIVGLALCLTSQAREPRHILQKAWESIDTSTVLTGKWCPYPNYRDRAAWDAFTGERKAELISRGEEYLDYEWRIIKATDYLAFERTGDRGAMQLPNGKNLAALSSLILAELAEGKGRFLDQIINGMWLQTERTTWVYSAHEYRQATGRALPDRRDVFIDLATQRVGHIVAIGLYFLEDEFDKVDPSISAAIRYKLKEQVFDPYFDKTKWRSQSWIGFPTEPDGGLCYWENWNPVNNWNVWCNCNVADIFLFAQKDRKQLFKGLELAVASVDNYLDFVDMDGACNEGPAYWEHASGCLFQFIHRMNDITGGKFGCWDDSQVRNLFTYISRVNLGDGWAANFSDGTARSTGSANLIFHLGKESGIREMADYAVYLDSYMEDSGRVKLSSHLPDVLEQLRYLPDYEKAMTEAKRECGGDVTVLRHRMRASIPAVTWYEGTQHIIMKHPSGVELAAKGGHNEESHNHNDVGNVILFADEMPVLMDVGPTTYMRQTFNRKERYTIWSMRSEWHNVPVINGVPQHDGAQYKASKSTADTKKFRFSTEISGAYEKEAACRNWTRTVSVGKRTVSISDKYELESRKAPDEEHFMVRGEVRKVKEGVMSLEYVSYDGKRSGRAEMRYSPNLKAEVGTRVLDDPRHVAIWGHDLKRIVLKSASDAPLKGMYKIEITLL